MEDIVPEPGQERDEMGHVNSPVNRNPSSVMLRITSVTSETGLLGDREPPRISGFWWWTFHMFFALFSTSFSSVGRILSPSTDSEGEDSEDQETTDLETQAMAVQLQVEKIEVLLLPDENPQNLSAVRKWAILVVVAGGALCATSVSSMASFTEKGIAQEFDVSKTESILSISFYMIGLGVGPLLVGPISEVRGRNIVYRVSYSLFFLFSFPVAFAPNLYIFLAFRLATGMCSSAFLAVAAGTVGDMFQNAEVATPMTFYTSHLFLSPVFGPLISGFINQHFYWRWTYRITLIWIFIILVLLFALVPETYAPVLLKQKLAREQKSGGKSKYWARIPNREKPLWVEIFESMYRPFLILIFDRMALCLDLWTAVILGILYLAFQVFPIIFMKGHNFNVQSTGLTFIGIGVGVILGAFSQIWWNKFFARKRSESEGNLSPEVGLIMGMYGGVLVPLGLLLLAFSSYPKLPWILPILASIPYGTGMQFVFSSVFTYLVIAYRPFAASAMAANSALRSLLSAIFPLISGAMYNRFGTVKATLILAGLTTALAPLPFIFFKCGKRLRESSSFTAF